jgi:hypothetical protein
MKNGFKVDLADENKLRIVLVVDGSESRPLIIDAVEAGPIAAHILKAANVSFRKSGRPPSETPPNVPVIQMDAMGSGNSGIPNHETLLFRFGDSALGIAVPKPMLKEMGETFLALSATESKPQ